jgi:hypothetical protein
MNYTELSITSLYKKWYHIKINKAEGNGNTYECFFSTHKH